MNMKLCGAASFGSAAPIQGEIQTQNNTSTIRKNTCTMRCQFRWVQDHKENSVHAIGAEAWLYGHLIRLYCCNTSITLKMWEWGCCVLQRFFFQRKFNLFWIRWFCNSSDKLKITHTRHDLKHASAETKLLMYRQDESSSNSSTLPCACLPANPRCVCSGIVSNGNFSCSMAMLLVYAVLVTLLLGMVYLCFCRRLKHATTGS